MWVVWSLILYCTPPEAGLVVFEIKAIPELLKTLSLKKAVLTVEALKCQKEIATVVIECPGLRIK